MQPLISEETYNELARLREQMASKDPNVAEVFVPVGPIITSVPRILFVGQSTYGSLWEAGLPFADAIPKSISHAKECLGNAGTSTFWQAIRSIADQVLRTVGAGNDPELTVGWSNLAKLGQSKTGNPKSDLLDAQAALCVRALSEEIEMMKPDATVLLTGNYADKEILLPAFGKSGWNNNVANEDRVAVKKHEKFGFLLWAYHPRDMRLKGFESDVANFISGFISGVIL